MAPANNRASQPHHLACSWAPERKCVLEQGTGKFWVRGTLLHKFTSRVISNSKGLDTDDDLQRDHEVRLLCSVESSAVSLAGVRNVTLCTGVLIAVVPRFLSFLVQ